MPLNSSRRLFCPEAGVADWTEVVVKDPIRDTETLSSSGAVRVAVVDTDVHARVDNLSLRLREAREEAGLLQGVRVRRGHLKIQNITPKEEAQSVRNRAAYGGMT